jgi:acetolactate synthase-1/2/3 large subunit
MNGAERVVKTLVSQGVDLCFTNPGTSEMHFLAAMDAQPGLRAVLALHENVATGAADGFARIAGRPASTLLHLGPGLANGLSNLHNAARALSPIVNIVGDHAVAHRRLDAPLTSDIEALARTVGVATRTAIPGSDIGAETAATVAQARGPVPGVSTLLLPADAAWSESAQYAAVAPVTPEADVPDAVTLKAAAAALRQPGAVLFLGFGALRGDALESAGKIAAATGAALVGQTTSPVLERGAGRVSVERLPFASDLALKRLSDVPAIVLAGARAPVAFFARPEQPGRLWSPGCALVELAAPHANAQAALRMLADHIGASSEVGVPRYARQAASAGDSWIGQALATSLVEDCIVVDEAMTHAVAIAAATASAAPHLCLQNMGGSIGYGGPVATGAAIAGGGRPVMSIIGDGSAMYTIQALWTQAREQLPVITLIIANRAYRILELEAVRMKVREPGRAMQSSLNIGSPDLDFVKLAQGMGVPGRRVSNAAQLTAALSEGVRSGGPLLIQADV